MSTKNLSRTVIEGGRDGYSKFQRRSSHGAERASARRLLARYVVDEDEADARAIPKRKKAYRGFADKLGPAERWMRAQCGRPWDKVRSELFARFDTRTLAGRHIVFGHMLPMVRTCAVTAYWSYYRFFVGNGGILRAVQRKRKRR